MKALEAIDALERQVVAGTLTLRAALAYAWQHGCTHGGGAPWPDYDVRRIGLKWAIVRVSNGHVVSTWDSSAAAHDAYVRHVCTPDMRAK